MATSVNETKQNNESNSPFVWAHNKNPNNYSPPYLPNEKSGSRNNSPYVPNPENNKYNNSPQYKASNDTPLDPNGSNGLYEPHSPIGPLTPFVPFSQRKPDKVYKPIIPPNELYEPHSPVGVYKPITPPDNGEEEGSVLLNENIQQFGKPKSTLAKIMGDIQFINEADEINPIYFDFSKEEIRMANSSTRTLIDEFSRILRPIYSKANKGYNPNFDVEPLFDEYKDKILNVRKNILSLRHQYAPKEQSKPIKVIDPKPEQSIDTKYRIKISKNPIFQKIRYGDANVNDKLSEINSAYDKISEEYKEKFLEEKERIEEWGNDEKEKIVAKYDLKREELEQFPKEGSDRDQELKRIDAAENAEIIRIEKKEEDELLVSKLKIIEMSKDRVKIEIKDDKDIVLPVDPLYVKSLIYEKIEVPFIRIGNNMNNYFKKYSERFIEGKCRKEGFIRPHSTSIVSSSTGLLRSDSVIYDVIYSVDICFPYENMEVMCKIKNITKIGIRGIITETNNPIVLFISREHNINKHFEDYEEEQMIKVKIIGNRFELNDEYISVIGEII
jgi:hypothetical protein